MKLFPLGHATHPDWALATGLVIAQLRAQLRLPGHANMPPLGLLYVTDAFALHAQDILDLLAAQIPHVTDWAGCVGVGIMAGEAEYIDEPALAVMLCDLAPHDYRVFSGVSPLPGRFAAATMMVHADALTPDLPDLVGELAERTRARAIVGGLVASRGPSVQFAWSSHGQLPGLAEPGRGVFEGGISGVALGPDVAWQARLAPGARAIGPRRRITAVKEQVVTELDGEPALAMLLKDGALPASLSRTARPELLALLRRTLVSLEPAQDALARASADAPREGGDVLRQSVAPRTQPIVGVDLACQGLAIAGGAGALWPGMVLTFCQRDEPFARRELVRAATELREAFEPAYLPREEADAMRAWAGADDEAATAGPPQGAGLAGAVYFSCMARAAGDTRAVPAGLRAVRHALGRVPLIGVLTAGEIAQRQLHTCTGVLLAFGAAGAPS